jgi:hypothetical protein
MNELMNWDNLDKIGIVVGVVTGIITACLWIYLILRDRKDNHLIAISLFVPSTGFKATLPGKIRRKDLTRAELQGMLGMLPMKIARDRYVLSVLNTSEFFKELEQAQVNRSADEVKIICDSDELNQFDSNRLKEVCKVTTATVENDRS